MKKTNRFYLWAGLLLAISEIWKQSALTWIVNGGAYYWWYFPFQLCSIPMYVCLLISITKNHPEVMGTLITYLMDYGLLGGTFAFLDTSGMHYSYAPLTVHSFAWHFLLLLIGIVSGLDKRADRSFKGFLGATGIFFLCCGIAEGLNILWFDKGEINLFYISPKYPMNQIIIRDIAKAVGDPAAIVLYILAMILGAGLFHLIWRRVSPLPEGDR